jgi:hypothetical protein
MLKRKEEAMAIDEIDRTIGTQGSTVAAGLAAIQTRSRRITPFTVLIRALFALALLVPVAIIAASPAAAATTIAPTTTCGSGLGNQGGRGLICEVTVINRITASGGSAVVTVRECLGSAGDPTDESGVGGFACSTKTVALAAPVSAVTQCNGSINGGGGKLLCSVMITNNFVGRSPGETTATVNQCVGSGASGGLKIKCNPVAADTGASITQCNGSANGLTLVGLTCTVTGKMASAFPITINQGNGSANGGGALIIASVTLINNALAPTASASASGSTSPGSSASGSTSPGSSASGSTGPGSSASGSTSPGSSASGSTGPGSSASGSTTPGQTVTPPATGTAGDGSNNDSTSPLFALLILLVVAGLGLAVIEAQRRSIRS